MYIKNQSTPYNVVPFDADSESREKERLEKKAQRGLTQSQAFYEAAIAVKEIRDRNLYKLSHGEDWKGYCKEVFDKSDRYMRNVITAAEIFQNLSGANCTVLPTKEGQIRELVGLEPEEQVQAWELAVKEKEGKVPSSGVIKGIIERLKEKPLQENPFQEGQLCKIVGKGDEELRKYSGCWAIVHVRFQFSCVIRVWDKVIESVKPEYLQPVDCLPSDLEATTNVCDRIHQLATRPDIAHTARAMLEVMGRQTQWSEDDIFFLECVEVRYGK